MRTAKIGPHLRLPELWSFWSASWIEWALDPQLWPKMSHLINKNRSGTFFCRGSGRAETVIIKNLINVSKPDVAQFCCAPTRQVASELAEWTHPEKLVAKKILLQKLTFLQYLNIQSKDWGSCFYSASTRFIKLRKRRFLYTWKLKFSLFQLV